MASILNKQTTYNITNVVENGIKTIKEIRSQDQSRREAEFQKAVAGGLSYADQIKFREEQLKDAKASGFVDETYTNELEKTIATTRQLARFQGIRDRYKQSLTDYTTGKTSLDSYVSVLESTLSGEADPAMRSELMGLLNQAHVERASNDIAAIKNRATIATKDKSLKLVEDSVSEIKSKKALAQINKNEEEVSMWDETLLALNGVKSKLQIENSLNELNFKIAKDNPKANDKLSYLNDEIARAGVDGPVTFDGVNYTSLKAFWENKRNEYISNNYFEEVKKELDSETAKIAATSKFGQIPTARIQAVSDFYNTIKTRPEFAAYADQIEQRRVADVSNLTNDLAESLQTEAQETGNFSKSQNAILNLENKFGVKVSRQPFGNEGSIATEVGKVTPSTITAPEATLPGARVGEYQVAQGENLSSIAAKNGVSLLDILDSNPEYKRNPSMVKTGAILKIPTAPKTITQETPVAPVAPTTTPAPAPIKPETITTPTPTPTKTPTSGTPISSTTTAPKKQYTSIVDLAKDKGIDSSYANRAKLAAEYGISNYKGTAEQNQQLINKLNV